MRDNKFSFFESYHRALSHVSNERYGRVVRAMSEFVFMGIVPSFADDADWIVWELIKPIIERGKEISEARSDVGRKGGLNGKGVSRNEGNKNAAKEDNKTIANKSKTIANNSGKGIGKGNGIGIGKGQDNLTNVSIDCVPDALSDSFEKFWFMYDKKRKRPACEKKWATLTDEQRQSVLIHVPKYVASTPEKRYRKDPLTYLNNSCWLDEIIDVPDMSVGIILNSKKNRFDNEKEW